jgi:hypothetical protein
VIGCYAVTSAVPAGGEALVSVSTNAKTFCLELVQLTAAGPRLIYRSPPHRGCYAPAAPGDADWVWPAFGLPVPAGAEPGVHLAVAVEVESYPTARAPDLVGFDGSCLLTVLPGPGRRGAAAILYKLPTQTYHAYNPAGGSSLYVNHAWSADGCAVSLRRPGCGTGGPSAEQIDLHGPGSPRQTFWHWDWPFLAWLERAGYPVDVVPDTQLDVDPGLLGHYRAVVTAGHDEYWTSAQRTLLEDFAAAGGSYAVFGANTCWWRCTLSGGLMTVRKDPGSPGQGPDLWWRQRRPENSLLGLSYRGGGGWWGGIRPDTRYHVTRPHDPLLDGADPGALARLGSLAGYECDGYSYTSVTALPDGRDGCPADFTVLAYAELPAARSAGSAPSAPGWLVEEREQPGGGPRVAAVGYLRRGRSLVFNAGTADWALHLAEPPVDRITRNVLSAIARD